jgi:hypothetical protein
MATQNKVFMVTPEYIIQNFAMYIDQNIDFKSINSAIVKAQGQDMQYTLGFNLYSVYIQLLTPTTPGDDSTMPIYLTQNIDYYNLMAGSGGFTASNSSDATGNGINIACIMDGVSLWAIYHLLDWLQFRVTNKSIVTKYSQWGSTVTENELNRLKYLVMEDAQNMDSEIRKEILNYPNTFQQYFTQIGVYRPPAKANPYDNFFISGKPGGRGGWPNNSTTSEWDAGYGRDCC